MERNDEISIAKCCNYTDLRAKNEVPEIEAEAIQNYARNLKPEEMRIFLAEVPYETLMEEASRKYYREHHDLEFIKGIFGK